MPLATQCQRCGGELSIECDQYGPYLDCIQCGATHKLNGELDITEPAAEGIELRGRDAGIAIKRS